MRIGVFFEMIHSVTNLLLTGIKTTHWQYRRQI